MLLFIFESPLVRIWRKVSTRVIHGCGSCCAKLNGKEYDDTDYSKAGFVYSDDIYFELSYGQLYKRHKQYRKDKQRYKVEKLKGIFTSQEIKLYIDPYIEILERNIKASWERILELVDIHDQMLSEEVFDYQSLDEMQKVDALKDFYDKAVDTENAERQIYYDKLDKEMHGRIMNEYKSYDLMDNEKYQRIEYLISVMQETFGFDYEGVVNEVKVIDEEADVFEVDKSKSNRSSSRSQETHNNRDEKNATVEMTVKPGGGNRATGSDFNIFSREGKRDHRMK